MTVFPSTALFLFPRLEIKLKGRHLDTTEVIVAESQAVLNTLPEQDFQDAFTKWKKRWERCIRAEGDYFEVANRSKVSVSDQMAASILETTDDSLNSTERQIFINSKK
jgi:hypothetical protein